MNGDSLFHAYVIGGSRESAREYIDALLAEHSEHFSERIDSEHVSFGIDDARAMRAWQELMPEAGRRKARVVYTDFLTEQAENALLKTLEEPTEGTHIFIAVPKPEVLLPTLLSRVRLVAPTIREGSMNDAKKFLALGRGERLAHIAKLVEKSEDDEAAAEVRERALTLIDGLERVLSTDPHKHLKVLETILKLKKYLYTPGASSRMILETLALVA